MKLSRRNQTILIVIAGIAVLGIAFVVSQLLQQGLAPEDTSADEGCNTCFSGKVCNNEQDWQAGWFEGCTNTTSSGQVVRNTKPDIDNSGTVQQGDQGVTGIQAGDNVYTPNATASGEPTQPTGAQFTGGGTIEDGIPVCRPAGGSYAECCGSGLARIIVCGSGGEFIAGSCDRADSACGSTQSGQATSCPQGRIYDPVTNTCKGTADGTGGTTGDSQPVVGGDNQQVGSGWNAVGGSSLDGSCLASVLDGSADISACGGVSGTGDAAATDVNPNYRGFYSNTITGAQCAAYSHDASVTVKAVSCEGQIYLGTVIDGSVSESHIGRACCASAASICNAAPSSLTASIRCQCGIGIGNECSQFAPRASQPTPIVSSCAGAPAGARTKCKPDNTQCYCENGAETSNCPVTDYCLVLNNPIRANLREGDPCLSTNLSSGEGGAFQGCSASGQACVCRNGALDCFMDTPDGYGYADSCPQGVPPVKDTPVKTFGTPVFYSSSTPGTPGTPDTPYTPPVTPPPVVITEACVYLDQVSPASKTITEGQTVIYQARYTCASLNQNLKLVVMDGSQSQVGSPTIVSPTTSIYDQANNTCTYNFTWTASGITTGDFDTRLLHDGTIGSIVETPTACTQDLTLNETTQLEPAVSIVKQSSHVCIEPAGGATINYTITLTNSGEANAFIDQVSDELPTGIVPATHISNISPAATIPTDQPTRLLWTISENLAPGNSLSFTYKVTLSNTELPSFADGLNNSASVVFDTPTTNDNSITFDLGTLLDCGPDTPGTPTIPSTGLFDDVNNVLIIGIGLMLIGIVVNRTNMIGNLFGFKTTGKDATSGLFKQSTKNFIDKLNPEVDTKRDRYERELLKDKD